MSGWLWSAPAQEVPKPRVDTPENAPLSAQDQEILDYLDSKLGDRLERTTKLTVLRFARGYTHLADYKEVTLKMMSAYLDWREEKKVQALADNDNLPGRQEFQRAWPHGVHGFGRKGHPVYIECPGAVAPTTLFENWTVDELLMFHVKAMEELCKLKARLSDERKEAVYKHICIIDLNGLGWAHCTTQFTTPLQTFINVDQSYYPESLYAMFIVNGGWLLSSLWGQISPWLDPITAKRITICNGFEGIDTLIDPSQIPRFLGGRCRCEGQCLLVPFVPGR
jgi:hypothetical protein